MIRHSEKLEELAKALVKAQSEFPDITDSREVTVKHKTGGSHSYSYAELAHMQKLIAPVLKENKLAVIQMPCSLPDGSSVLCTRIMHESGQWAESDAPLSKGHMAAQDYGSQISYLCRYTLKTALFLRTTGDDDGAQAHKATQKQMQSESKSPIKPKTSIAPRTTFDKPLPSDQVTLAWQTIKKSLGLDDTQATEFLLKHTGKRTTSALMESDVKKIKDGILQEKAAKIPGPSFEDYT